MCPHFQEMLERLAAGDNLAWQELTQKYGRHIRRIVRTQLALRRARAVSDSAGLEQSVMVTLFRHLRRGSVGLDGEQHLLNLLSKIARDRLVDRLRSQGRNRALTNGAELLEATQAPTEGPEEVAQRNERSLQVIALLKRLPGEVRWAVEDWLDGRSWVEIGEKLGLTPAGARMRVSRALRELQVNC